MTRVLRKPYIRASHYYITDLSLNKYDRKTKGSRLVYHDGDLGNYLIAFPDQGLAVVRTIDMQRGRGKPNNFEEIYSLIPRLLTGQDPRKTQ